MSFLITHKEKNSPILLFLKGAFFLLFVLCSSCNQYYYAPNEGAILALSESQDAKVSFGIGPHGDQEGSNASLQIGYSPIKYLALQSSYFQFSGDRLINETLTTGNSRIINGAIGTYKFFPMKRSYDREETIPLTVGMPRGLLVDFYAGYGDGNVNTYYEVPASSHFEFNKKFLQAGVHWQGRIVGVDMVLKSGVLDFSAGEIIGNLGSANLKDVQNIELNDTYDFRESTIRVHLGIRHARLFVSRSWFNSSKFKNVAFLESTFHFGTIIEIDEFFRKRK